MRAATRFAVAAALFFLAGSAWAQVPTAPELTAEAVCSVSNDVRRPAVRLQWTDSDGASQYDVFRDGVALATALSTDTTQYLDASSDVSTQHTYVVHAVNPQGTTSSNSVIANAPASVCPAPPSAPVLSGNVVCDTSASPKRPIVNLSWTAVSGATSYDVVRNDDIVQSTSNTNLTDVGVVAGASYSYFVRANNSGGFADSNRVNISIASDICGAPPGMFTASTSASCSNGNPKVTVSWTAAAGATSYIVDRNDGTVSPALSASTLSYDDTTVSVDTPYTYSVNAINSSGSSQSNSFITVPANVCSGGPPSAPSAVNGTIVCNGTTPKIHLTWSGATNATSYSVLRDGNVIATGLTALSYDDSSVANGNVYNYVVRAVNASGSADSNPPFMTLLVKCEGLPSAPVVSASVFCVTSTSPGVHVTWTASDSALTYTVRRDGELISGPLGSQTLSYDDTTVIAGQMYTYSVQATNNAGSTLSSGAIISVSSTQCGAQLHPDLAVTSVTLNKTSAKAGDAITVSFTIANSGNTNAGASTLRIRIGTQPARQSSDLVEASNIVPPINAGATFNGSQPIQVPNLPSGTYYIHVSADDDHSTGDVNVLNDTGHASFSIIGVPQHQRAARH
jgi:fibronectin type 3 domain-containing protein